jgi:hypothetical protein
VFSVQIAHNISLQNIQILSYGRRVASYKKVKIEVELSGSVHMKNVLRERMRYGTLLYSFILCRDTLSDISFAVCH